jgi:hypothetical protein
MHRCEQKFGKWHQSFAIFKMQHENYIQVFFSYIRIEIYIYIYNVSI